MTTKCTHLWYKETKSKAGLVTRVTAHCRKGMGGSWIDGAKEIDPVVLCKDCPKYDMPFTYSDFLARRVVNIETVFGVEGDEDE